MPRLAMRWIFSLKDQYDSLATPHPPHLTALVKHSNAGTGIVLSARHFPNPASETVLIGTLSFGNWEKWGSGTERCRDE
jgi:hypothetical protein